MKRKFYLLTIGALSAAAISSAVGVAYASKSADNDALAVTGEKISLIQAVTAAEQHVGGKASRAEYERHKGQWIFEVEVVKESKVMDVKVDPTNASIIASAEDKRDHQDNDDREKSDR